MLFDPFELDTSVTPGRIREALRQREFTRAILMAFRLNERKLAQEALEAVPQDESKPGPTSPVLLIQRNCVHPSWQLLCKLSLVFLLQLMLSALPFLSCM